VSERVQTNVRLESDTKQRWQEYATEEGYGSVATLIRVAVNNEIDDRNDGNSGGSPDFDIPAANTDEVERRLDKLETSVNDATTAMMQADLAIDSEITTDVWELIPEGPENAAEAETIAEGAEYDATTVRVALEQLSNSTPTVTRIKFESHEDGESITTTHAGREIEISPDNRGHMTYKPRFFKRG